jgi:NhaP-type Na+/H+ or K+/H+ antiporter
MGAVAVIAGCFVLWGLVSARLPGWNVSAPMAFVAAGMALGAGSEPVLHVSISSGAVLQLTELTLAVVLFGDAATVSMRWFREDAALPGRLLLVGLPLTMALGTLGAHLLLPGLSWWVAAVIGVAVAPTDAALGAAIMEDERVPVRIRQVLNVESGLNDGIATPFVSFFLAAAVAGTALGTASRGDALVELGLGLVVGVAVGAAGCLGLAAALRRGLAEPGFLPIATAAIALVAYAGAVGLEGNGFVAAFAAGLAHRAVRGRALPEGVLHFTHQGGQVLSLVVWFLFGALVLEPLGNATWREVTFALLTLTLVRMVPVALSLLGSGLDRATVAVVGWFGPRGLASVVFAILAAEALDQGTGSRVLAVIGCTVLFSVVLHGASAAPIAGRFGASHTDPGR